MIRVSVDPTNPGQFFACCGLLELADRLWPDSEGGFEAGGFCLWPKATNGNASAEELLNQLVGCALTNTMTPEQVIRLDELAAMKGSGRAKAHGLEEEKNRSKNSGAKSRFFYKPPSTSGLTGSATIAREAVGSKPGQGNSRFSI
jgi:CRISPR-associated protein Csb3